VWRWDKITICVLEGGIRKPYGESHLNDRSVVSGTSPLGSMGIPSFEMNTKVIRNEDGLDYGKGGENYIINS